jgi:hypothetical protein
MELLQNLVVNVTFGSNGAFIYSDVGSGGSADIQILASNFTNISSSGGMLIFFCLGYVYACDHI